MYEEIIENMKNGDEDALCKLYLLYAQSALRSAYLITNNLHSAHLNRQAGCPQNPENCLMSQKDHQCDNTEFPPE